MSRFSILPKEELRPYIDRIWGWIGEKSLPYVLPGTGCEVFLYDNPPYLSTDSGLVKLPGNHAGCPRYKGIKLVSGGMFSLVAVRFKSSAFRHFVPFGMVEFRDKILSTDDLWGKDGEDMAASFYSASSIDLKIKILENHLVAALRKYSRDDLWLDEFISDIYYADSEFSLSDHYESAFVGKRQIERLILAATGVSPKYFHRTARFQRTIRSILVSGESFYLEKALEAGYYDQPHFLHDFKHYTGKNPSDFLTKNGFMTHFYNTSNNT